MYGQEQSHCRQLCYLQFERYIVAKEIVVALVAGPVACFHPHSKLVAGVIVYAMLYDELICISTPSLRIHVSFADSHVSSATFQC